MREQFDIIIVCLPTRVNNFSGPRIDSVIQEPNVQYAQAFSSLIHIQLFGWVSEDLFFSAFRHPVISSQQLCIERVH